MLTKNIDKFASLTRQHAEADLLVQGEYYDEDTGKGCFIGCFAHGNRPEVLAEEFGIPVMLTLIAERIFESLPKDEARAFFLAIPGAIGTDGKDLSRVGWAFLADTLRAMPPQDGAVKQAVDDVISGLDRLAAGGEFRSCGKPPAQPLPRPASYPGKGMGPRPGDLVQRPFRVASGADPVLPFPPFPLAQDRRQRTGSRRGRLDFELRPPRHSGQLF